MDTQSSSWQGVRTAELGGCADGQIKGRTLRLGTVVCFQLLGSQSDNVRRLPSMYVMAGKEGV
jgi:hypothetical protein